MGEVGEKDDTAERTLANNASLVWTGIKNPPEQQYLGSSLTQ